MLASHPAWGYVDQPPLTPILAKLGIAIFGDNLWGIRIPALICALVVLVLTALVARELGGAALAQTFAVAGASSTFLFVDGHTLLTASPDLVVWLAVILFAARALLRSEPRWWLAAGLAVGLGLYNKQLIALLLIGLAVGLLIAGPRRELANRWLWAGVGIALVISLPNLIFQIQHGWPEVTMARVIAKDKGPDDRVFFVPFQIILLGVTVLPIWIVGLVRVLRDAAWRPVRALAWAYPVVGVIVLVTGGQPYYTFGLIDFLYAAGSVVLARWVVGRPGRWALAWTAIGVSTVMAVLTTLPVFPVGSIPSVITTVNETAGDSIGWPQYVRQVAMVYRSLPTADQAQTALLAENYGEAGALDRFGPGYGLPAVYSGHNQLYYLGPPPESATVVIVVGYDHPETLFDNCVRAATLDNGVGVDNEEQGRSITVCRRPRESWQALWPANRHYG
jgi:hypothetical protein